MFQDNQLLIQLKKQLHSQIPRVEGLVKSTEQGFGFLEVNTQKKYFIPPLFMRKVMHGDKISAILRTEKNRKIAEPEKLIKPSLTRFIGRVQLKNKHLSVVPDHPLIKEVIPTRILPGIKQIFQTGDWTIAEMRSYPLKGDHHFYAEIISLITHSDDLFAPWLVTLARYNLERTEPSMPKEISLKENGMMRQDLTELDFITIDSASTEDMDDAIYITETSNGAWIVTVAITDTTAWIPKDSPIDNVARERAFTRYLPGFNIPMLPRVLSDDLCSLRAYEKRPALVCRFTVRSDGTLVDDAYFFIAWIKSKGKLNYSNVSDWLENLGSWQPETEAIASQIRLLYDFYLKRSAWRYHHTLLFQDRPDYRFILDKKGNIDNIILEPRRIANRMIEEAMIAANICAAYVLCKGLGYGLYNVHYGFNPLLIDQAVAVLRSHNININPADLLTIEGFCSLRRRLNAQPSSYLENRIRRFQTFSEISIIPGPHFGLGLNIYATWTSPMRKYSDIINHRLLKALVGIGFPERPNKDIIFSLTEKRRQNRIVEREIVNWLYARFLQSKIGNNNCFLAEIIDVLRNGMRIRLLDNGAVALVPASFIHGIRSELVCNQDTGIIKVKGEERYRQGDILNVILTEVKMENRSVIARPI